MTDPGLKARLAGLAHEAGFAACGIAPATEAAHAGAFREWLREGHAAGMDWLSRSPERRTNPQAILPGVRSVVMLAMNYFQGPLPPGRTGQGRIARYAWGDDYHAIMIERMRPLDAALTAAGGVQRLYVDTGPILERDLAAMAGIGWHGKSTMLLNRRLGTWFFLGEILTTVPLEPDPPARDHCGSCTRCIVACPTGAIVAPRKLDARRCISYLTIEHKGPIPLEFRAAMHDRIYGCDDCLDACPWNRFAATSREAAFQARDGIADRPLREFLSLDDAGFRALFRRSPIRRIKRARFLRNVCVALGNVGAADDLEALGAAVMDPDPLIAEHAAWAHARILDRARGGP